MISKVAPIQPDLKQASQSVDNSASQPEFENALNDATISETESEIATPPQQKVDTNTETSPEFSNEAQLAALVLDPKLESLADQKSSPIGSEVPQEPKLYNPLTDGFPKSEPVFDRNNSLPLTPDQLPSLMDRSSSLQSSARDSAVDPKFLSATPLQSAMNGPGFVHPKSPDPKLKLSQFSADQRQRDIHQTFSAKTEATPSAPSVAQQSSTIAPASLLQATPTAASSVAAAPMSSAAQSLGNASMGAELAALGLAPEVASQPQTQPTGQTSASGHQANLPQSASASQLAVSPNQVLSSAGSLSQAGVAVPAGLGLQSAAFVASTAARNSSNEPSAKAGPSMTSGQLSHAIPRDSQVAHPQILNGEAFVQAKTASAVAPNAAAKSSGFQDGAVQLQGLQPRERTEVIYQDPNVRDPFTEIRAQSVGQGTVYQAPQAQRVLPKVSVDGHVTLGSMATERFTSQSVQQMSGGIRRLSSAGGGEMRIRLKPDTLGELNLKVSTSGNQVGLRIQAADDRARRVLQDSIGYLRESLGTKNLNLAKVDIVLSPQTGQPTGLLQQGTENTNLTFDSNRNGQDLLDQNQNQSDRFLDQQEDQANNRFSRSWVGDVDSSSEGSVSRPNYSGLTQESAPTNQSRIPGRLDVRA